MWDDDDNEMQMSVPVREICMSSGEIKVLYNNEVINSCHKVAYDICLACNNIIFPHPKVYNKIYHAYCTNSPYQMVSVSATPGSGKYICIKLLTAPLAETKPS